MASISSHIIKAAQEYAFIQKGIPGTKCDFLPEIPLYYCQKCGNELRIIWDPQSTHDNEYKAIGMICTRCFIPEEYLQALKDKKDDQFTEDYSCDHLEDGY